LADGSEIVAALILGLELCLGGGNVPGLGSWTSFAGAAQASTILSMKMSISLVEQVIQQDRRCLLF